MRIIDMILKDLKIKLSDKKVMAILILMPIILISILGNSLKGSFMEEENNKKVKVAIVKNYNVREETDKYINFLERNKFIEENKEKTREKVENINIENKILDGFLENEKIKKVLDTRILSEKESRALLKKEDIDAIIIFPEDFIYRMYINFSMPFRNNIEIKVIGEPNKEISSSIVSEIMKGYTDSLSSIVIGKNIFLESAVENNIEIKEIKNLDKVIENITSNLENRDISINHKTVDNKQPLSSFQFYSIGMGTMFLLFTCGEGGYLLLEEKKKLTYQRMKIAGIPTIKILTGKFISIFLLSLIQMTIIILFTRTVYKVEWGNTFDVFIITISSVFSISGLGIILASLASISNSEKLLKVFESMIINVMTLLGGGFFPTEMFPESIQKLKILSINGLANDAYRNIAIGGGIEEVKIKLLALVIVGLISILLSLYIVRLEQRWENA